MGVIFPDGEMRQVFLGTLVLGDEKRAMQYGRDPDRDIAAFVEKVGPGRWRMVLPRPAFESMLDVIEQHRRRKHLGGGVRDALPGDIRRAAMYRLEDRRVRADVGPGGETEPTDEAGDFIAENVTNHVGGDHTVEPLGLPDQLRGALGPAPAV